MKIETWVVKLTITVRALMDDQLRMTTADKLEEYLREGIQDVGGEIEDMRVISTTVETGLLNKENG